MNYINKFKTLIFCLILLVGVSVVSAWTGPTSTPTGGNVAPPITSTSAAQYKTGDLAISKTSAPTSGYGLDVDGLIRAKGMLISGTAQIAGFFIDDSLKYTKLNTTDPDRRACLDTNGILTWCTSSGSGVYETITIKAYAGSYTTFTAPTKIKDNKITVEAWGGGGGGFGGTSGDASYIKKGTTFQITANGGSSTSNASSGGAGGSVNATGTQTGITIITNTSGSSGGAGGSATPPSSSFTCPPPTNTVLWTGGTGGNGGYGGSSGGSGNNPGGNGATPPNINCPISLSTLLTGLWGNSGGTLANTGTGGSGWGGKSGDSSAYNYNGSMGAAHYNGYNGYPGGGGGGYFKAEIITTPGQIYTINGGKGGSGLTDSFSYTGSHSISSGNGSDGIVIVTFEQEK